MNGPICAEIYYPRAKKIWCAGEMMNFSEVPAYAFKDFWSVKPSWIRWLYKILSYIIAPIAVLIFNYADCIGVYHDARVMGTFKETIAALKAGDDIIIFPEKNEEGKDFLYAFSENFVDVAKMYCKKGKNELRFVPMYIAPALKSVYFGESVLFNAEAPIEDERKRISESMRDEILELAKALPRHRVVPYANIPKRDYPFSKEA